jgi:hypothetical protein
MTVAAPTGSLDRLQKLYRTGYGDSFVDNALRKIIDRQIARDEADLARIDAELRSFEVRFGMASDQFWQQYQRGQLNDTEDFTEWNVFCKMRQRIFTRLGILHEQ